MVDIFNEFYLSYAMDNIEDMLKDVTISQYEMETGEEVHVTLIIDLHNFYTRPVKYAPFVDQFETLQPQVKPSTIKVHDMVVFNLERSETVFKFARGKVFRVNDKHVLKCDIFAVDYGYFETSVPLQFIWECDQKFLDIPPLISYCGLARCDPCEGEVAWSEEAIDAFKYYVGDEKAYMRIVENNIDKLMVELYNSQPEDIASMLSRD